MLLNFNLYRNSWTMRNRCSILGKHTPLMKVNDMVGHCLTVNFLLTKSFSTLLPLGHSVFINKPCFNTSIWMPQLLSATAPYYSGRFHWKIRVWSLFLWQCNCTDLDLSDALSRRTGSPIDKSFCKVFLASCHACLPKPMKEFKVGCIIWNKQNDIIIYCYQFYIYNGIFISSVNIKCVVIYQDEDLNPNV